MDHRDVQPHGVTHPPAVTSKVPSATADSSSGHAPTRSASDGNNHILAPSGPKIAKRGENRTGYYLALLYALECQYRVEGQTKGSRPLRWHPLPRNRPDQFATWIINDLELLGAPPPEHFGGLLERLAREQLPYVANVLQYVVERRLLGANPDIAERTRLRALPSQELIARLGKPTRSVERHPQARKFAQVIRRHLDRAWKEALILTAAEYEQESGGAHSAFLIGALPPSFNVINAHIFANLDDADPVAEPTALTVLQFYGLVTGTLPAAPAPWREGLEALAGLSDEELALLSSLSDHQVRYIRTLGKETLTLLREYLRHSPSHRYKLADIASDLDEEVARMMAHKKLTPHLIRHLQSWSSSSWQAARELLGEHAPWATVCLQDWTVLNELFAERTRARLGLRDLFPVSLAWLDGYLTRHFEDAALHDVGELKPFAAAISRRLQQHLLEQTGMEGAQISQDIRNKT